MGHRGVVDVDSIVLAKVPEDRASKSCTQVGDGSIGHTKAMLDVSDEFDCFFRCYFHNRSDFDRLGEFVDGHKYMFVAARSSMKLSHGIETPHSERPRRRDGAQGLSWQVLLFGKELASFAPFYEVFSIGYGRGPVESRSVCFTDQIVGRSVAATIAAVDLS
jgi:hypothetical protein